LEDGDSESWDTGGRIASHLPALDNLRAP